MDRIWCSGLDEISQALGICRDNILVLIRKEGLPAFKISEGRTASYFAFKKDLVEWGENMRDKRRVNN